MLSGDGVDLARGAWRRRGKDLPVESNALQKILEPGVATQRVISRVYFKSGEAIGMLCTGRFQPGDSGIVVPHADVGRSNSHRIYGLPPVPIQQFP